MDFFWSRIAQNANFVYSRLGPPKGWDYGDRCSAGNSEVSAFTAARAEKNVSVYAWWVSRFLVFSNIHKDFIRQLLVVGADHPGRDAFMRLLQSRRPSEKKMLRFHRT
jgi:hypothetical protein